jgi:hypothetical protein
MIDAKPLGCPITPERNRELPSSMVFDRSANFAKHGSLTQKPHFGVPS